MLQNGQHSAAFFLSRRLVTRGEDWAIQYMEQAKTGLDQDDEVIIPWGSVKMKSWVVAWVTPPITPRFNR